MGYPKIYDEVIAWCKAQNKAREKPVKNKKSAHCLSTDCVFFSKYMSLSDENLMLRTCLSQLLEPSISFDELKRRISKVKGAINSPIEHRKFNTRTSRALIKENKDLKLIIHECAEIINIKIQTTDSIEFMRKLPGELKKRLQHITGNNSC